MTSDDTPETDIPTADAPTAASAHAPQPEATLPDSAGAEAAQDSAPDADQAEADRLPEITAKPLTNDGLVALGITPADLPDTLPAQAAMDALNALADPARAESNAAYHKARRIYLGIAMPQVNDLVKDWRAQLTLDQRITLASALWGTDVHEARVAAAKLLTQARIRPSDAESWTLLQSWVPQFDGWAVADHACSAGARRVMADLSRLDTLAEWTTSDHMWTKRAALVITLPLAHMNFLDEAQQTARDRVLGWAADYTADRAWFIQKAIAWWLRDLSKHDAPRVQAFLADHGDRMKPFARKEAGKYL